MTQHYGIGAATYKAAGGLNGIRQLVDDFYTLMAHSTDYQTIRNMHPQNLTLSKDKLSCFLSGWMGGEALYQQQYGSINIPQYHAFIQIGEQERDQWLSCMQLALEKQPYPTELKQYLLKQLRIPAERIRLASVARHG